MRRDSPLRRIVTVVAVAAVALAGCKAGDDDDRVTTATTGDGSGGDNTLPPIFQEVDDPSSVDWGDGCDTETGRLKIPIADAAPCIEPWDETQDNGGATSQGVTADEVVVAVYKGQPDPLQQALAEDAGADTDPDATVNTVLNYLRLFEDVYETYGRTLRLEVVEGSGGPADPTAAVADAQKVVDLKPFAAIGGPTQTPAYWQELVDAGIICVGLCSLAETQKTTQAAAPYLWPTGPSPDEADQHLLELIGKQLGGKPAAFAGDEALQSQERVFGFVQAETEIGEYKERNDNFADALQEQYGVEFAARSSYLFDLTRGQETATTVITRMKDAGVTTIALSVDPFMPKNLTEEATKQDYFPEWVIGPTVLVDTTFFSRTYDQRQWAHAFGISLPAARADNELEDSWRVHEWYYGEDPPVNAQAVQYPGPFRLLTGIHLAGPNLTPETFKAGLFRFPPEEPGKTRTHDSWGQDIWPFPDYNSSDDATAIWYDPDATGEDEAGNEGVGMLRYIDGGTRYLPNEWPEDPMPFFEEEGSVTIYDELPESDAVADYPPWPGSPAAG